MRLFHFVCAGAMGAAVLLLAACRVQPQSTTAAEPKERPGQPGEQAPPASSANQLHKLSAEYPVWLDVNRKAVVVDGKVCLREGPLEMFACQQGTKEHESVVSLDCLAEEVHAGLLRVGGKPGTPVSFDPEYKRATGQIIDVYVLWKDEKGAKRQARAQEWVKDAKTGKALAYDWIFAGSGFWKDDQTGREHYKANGGDMICVSNFPTAMLDLPIESSESNTELMFEAFTDQIPPKGTNVRIVLIPRQPADGGQTRNKGDKES
jgi:hypothetical protein